MKPGMKWLPVVDLDLCSGCEACVEACGPGCLEIQDGVAVISRPHDCGSEEHCIEPCPTSCIHMTWVPMTGDHSIGKWKETDA